MKEQLLQLKQDIVDISNNLKTNLADKGVEASGTLSELVNSVSDIPTPEDGDVWSEIGFTVLPEPLKSGVEYAKQIKKKFDGATLYSSDKNLYIFPKAHFLKDYLAYVFADSNLMICAPFTFEKNGVDLSNAFMNCINLVLLPQLDYTKCLIMNRTFEGCTNLLNMGTVDCSNVISIEYLFRDCYKLTYNPLINTENVTSMLGTFYKCLNLDNPDLSNLNTSNVTDMRSMFASESYFVSNIKKLDLSSFDTSKVTDMSNMFKLLRKLETLILPENFGSASTKFNGTFGDCSVLETIGIINSVSATNMTGMFEYCGKLKRIESINVRSMPDLDYNRIFGFSDLNKLRYFLCKEIGTLSTVATVQFSYYKLTNWGVASDDVPDARLSVIDSLITYSFDRATAGYNTCKLYLSTNTKALLTEDEIAQITAKGYTLV